MTRFRSLAVLGVAALALSTAACGGRQSGAARLNTSFDSALASIPANAALALGYQTDREAGGASTQMMNAAMGTTDSWVLSAVDLSGPIDSAYFLHEGAAWMVIRQEDPNAVIDNLRSAEDVSERRIGGRVVLRRVAIGEQLVTDVTTIGRHVVMRSGTTLEESDADVAFIRLASEWGGEASLIESPQYRNVAGRLQGARVDNIASIDLAGLNATLRLLSGTDLDPSELISGFGAGGVDQAECDAIETRLLTNFPGLVSVSGKNAAGETHVAGLTRLSAEGRARASQLFSGAPELGGLVNDVLFGGGFSFDYGTFLTTMKAEPRHLGCQGIAGLAGAAATAARDANSQVQLNRRTVSGTIGFVVQDVDFAGFVPTISAGLIIHSPNAPALLDRVVRMLNEIGSGDVISDTSVPTLQFNLTAMPMRVRVMQGSDRVVLVFGNVRENTQTALLNASLRGSNKPITEFFANGARIRALADELQSYLSEMEIMDAQSLEETSTVFDTIRRATDMSVQSRITAEGIESSGKIAAP